MPIYDYNGFKRETVSVDYIDDERRFAENTRVVQLGYGDICIGIAKSANDAENEITFGPKKRTAIGDRDDTVFVADPPVRLVFDKVESLDLLIHECQRLRDKMAGVATYKKAA